MTENVQERIVRFDGGNVVVSASAGCGKTTTMIRRITRLILDKKCGTDELLVVTFTNAAAAEMKEKLANALKEVNDCAYVTEQLYKLETADICTIDSFCSRVLRKYFYEAEVDPDFEIAEEGECAMLKLRAAESAVAMAYAAGEEGFLRLADALGGDRTDRALVRLVMRLGDLSANFSDREAYLREILPDNFRSDGAAAQFLCRDVSETLAELAARFCALRDDLFLAESDARYCETLAAMLESSGEKDYEGWRAFFGALSLPSVPPLKKKEREDEAICGAHESVKAAKTALGAAVKRFREKYFFLPLAELEQKCETVRPMLDALVDLTLRAGKEFSALKERNGMLDFQDVERHAFSVLQKDSVRGELLSRYRFVFLDEAQDVNRFQEELLDLLSRGDNVFLVGDLKQCIYRFRGAKPEIFAERCQAAEGREGFFRLSENFRTNADILAFVNRVFDGCMKTPFFPVDYAKSERLAGRKSGKVSDGRPAVVCNLIRRRPDADKRIAPPLYAVQAEERSAGAAEGAAIAREITRLVHGEKIEDEQGARSIRYRDIAVLVRGKKSFSEGVRGALAAAGIPVACDFAYPLLHYPEITVLVDYLKVVDNLRQDVPLVSALSSSFGRFSAEELARIRLLSPEGGFADAFLHCAGVEEGSPDPETVREAAAAVAELSESDAALKRKCETFYRRLEKFRLRAKVLSCPDLIAEIVRECRYDAALEREGEGKLSRLQSFLDGVCARTYPESLSRFLRFLEEFSDTLTIAERSGESDATLVTTIHKSKGLEYPVVFLAGLDAPFNFGEAREPVCVDLTLGGAMDCYDPETRTREELPLSNAVRRSIRYNAVRDETNLLYVAMTRAKYRLYLSGACEPEDEEEPLDVRNANCFLDLILPALAGSGAEINRLDAEAEEEPRPPVPIFRTDLSPYLPVFGFRYAGRSDLPIKATVTELNAAFGETVAPTERALFSEPFDLVCAESGTERPSASDLPRGDPRTTGTAYHKYLEFCDPAVRTARDLRADVERLSDVLTENERKMLDPAILLPFFAEVYGTRKPERILREQPFMMVAPARELIEGGGEEPLLVQGKIDLLLIYADGAEVVDYKFSRLSEAELAAKYRRQAEIYCRAAERCLDLPIKGGYLYHFGLKRLISVKN